MKYFNKKCFYAAFLSVIFVFNSCESIRNTNNAQRGAVIGTASGAILGGILGNNAGHGGKGATGAVIGAVVGGVAGGLIGNKMDKQAKEIEEALPGAEIERVGEGIKVILGESTVNFEFDSAGLTAKAKKNLDKLISIFSSNPDTNIDIYGHTDSKGSASYNQKLSERRANSVVSYLIRNGISRNRLSAMGLGKDEPIASNDTAEGRAKNRRVEFAITANEKMVQESTN